MDAQEAAFIEVLNSQQDRIMRICSLYANTRDEQQDLFQEVLLQLWKAFPRYRAEAQLSTYLYRVCLNTCLKRLYKVKKKEDAQLQLQYIHWLDVMPDKPDERLEYLRQCIRRLPEADQLVVSLFLEDLPYSEIGNIAGISENHVAVKMKRIKAKLFNCINEKL